MKKLGNDINKQIGQSFSTFIIAFVHFIHIFIGKIKSP